MKVHINDMNKQINICNEGQIIKKNYYKNLVNAAFTMVGLESGKKIVAFYKIYV